MRISDEQRYRLLEIFPGATVWAMLLSAILFSFWKPLIAIAFIVVFDLLWLFRVVLYLFRLFSAWRRFREATRTDWSVRLASLASTRAIYHLIFLPTFREEYEIIRQTLKSLQFATYPAERLLIVLAGEEKDRARFEANAALAQEEFKGVFGAFLVTLHPADLSGEIPGKGSNLAWAGRCAQELIDQRSIPYENIIVSSFDVDTLAHPQYFSYLTFLYLTTPDAAHASYQPIALYNNNIWESPAAVRIAAFGTTLWLMTDLTKSKNLITFSSHSMPFVALVDVGFWQKDIVSEDSRIFLQCLVHYHGRYRVVPLYLPVSMDTVATRGYRKSLGALYRQVRRWAWGVENFPYLAEHLGRDPQTPWNIKRRYIGHAWLGMFDWATAPILIFMLGWLPMLVANLTDLKTLAFVQDAPHTLQWIMTFANFGIIASAALTLILIPRPGPHVPASRRLFMIFQWVLLPITSIFFGAIPAIDAVTRLMLGKRLGFNVTEKQRRTLSLSPLEQEGIKGG